MKESLLIVAFFAAGILCGRFDLAPDFASSDFTSMALLCLLMVCVGISIGSNGRLREILRSLSPRVLLFPLATGLGTYAASAACCLFLGYSVWQCWPWARGSAIIRCPRSSSARRASSTSALSRLSATSSARRTRCFSLLLWPVFHPSPPSA